MLLVFDVEYIGCQGERVIVDQLYVDTGHPVHGGGVALRQAVHQLGLDLGQRHRQVAVDPDAQRELEVSILRQPPRLDIPGHVNLCNVRVVGDHQPGPLVTLPLTKLRAIALALV